MVETRYLRQFIAVAEELHFRRAAERLHMAQPPLTQAIQRLEQTLGVRLFDRNNRSVTLTPSGRAFLQEAKLAIEQVDRAVRHARLAHEGRRGRLRVTFFTGGLNIFLSEKIVLFRKQFGDVELDLKEAPTSEQLELLITNRADVGLLIPPSGKDEARILEMKTAYREPFVAALWTKHPQARQKKVPLEKLANDPFIIAPAIEGFGYYSRVMTICGAAGFTPRVVQEAREWQTIIGLVAGELGVALLPASSSRLFKQPNVEFRPILVDGSAPKLDFELALCWRKDQKFPVLELFLQHLLG